MGINDNSLTSPIFVCIARPIKSQICSRNRKNASEACMFSCIAFENDWSDIDINWCKLL